MENAIAFLGVGAFGGAKLQIVVKHTVALIKHNIAGVGVNQWRLMAEGQNLWR